jgi:uncharacterized membrane protein YeiH
MIATAVPDTVIGLDASVERALDLAGIFVFALSGGLLAVRKHFDLVGVVVLAAVTALGGGLIRDLLLGDTPPAAFRDTTYLIVPLVGSLVVFAAHGAIDRWFSRAHLVFDAAGLGLFVVVGTVKALSFGMNGIGAVALGVTTATGGGVLRDVLAREEPSLFRADSVLYGIPAALGAVAVAVSWQTDTYRGLIGAAVAAGVFALRIAALRFGWHAPRPLPQPWSSPTSAEHSPVDEQPPPDVAT